VLSQALPLLFDTSGAWSDMDVDAPAPELQEKLGVAPESLGLRFLLGLDDSDDVFVRDSVRLALAPGFLVRENPDASAEAKFLTTVRSKNVEVACAVVMFVQALAMGTYALPRDALRKVRRWEAALSEAGAGSAAGEEAALSEAGAGSAAGEPPPARGAGAEAAAASSDVGVQVAPSCNLVWYCVDGQASSCFVSCFRWPVGPPQTR
jgi:hypothetical protein